MSNYSRDLIYDGFDENDKEVLETKNANLDTNNFIKNIDMNKKNSAVPKPPKPGEIMYCNVCGKPIMPEDFSEDDWNAKYEFKWHLHSKCRIYAHKRLDYLTKGLLSERRASEPVTEKKKEVFKPKSYMELAKQKRRK